MPSLNCLLNAVVVKCPRGSGGVGLPPTIGGICGERGISVGQVWAVRRVGPPVATDKPCRSIRASVSASVAHPTVLVDGDDRSALLRIL